MKRLLDDFAADYILGGLLFAALMVYGAWIWGVL